MSIKIFISMPLNELSTEDIESNRERNRKDLIPIIADKYNVDIVDVEILDNYINAEPDPSVYKTIPLYFLGKVITDYLAKADVLVLGHGWDNARGCLCEMFIAANYGLPVYNLDTGKWHNEGA